MNTVIASSPETATPIGAISSVSTPITSAPPASSPPLDLAEINRQLAEVQAQGDRLREVATQLKAAEDKAAKAEAATQLAAHQTALRDALASLGADSAAKGYVAVRRLFVNTSSTPKVAKRNAPKAKTAITAKVAAPKVAVAKPSKRASKVNSRGHKLVVRGPYPAEVRQAAVAALGKGASVRSLHEMIGVGALTLQNWKHAAGLVGKDLGGLDVADLIREGKVAPLPKAA